MKCEKWGEYYSLSPLTGIMLASLFQCPSVRRCPRRIHHQRANSDVRTSVPACQCQSPMMVMVVMVAMAVSVLHTSGQLPRQQHRQQHNNSFLQRTSECEEREMEETFAFFCFQQRSI